MFMTETQVFKKVDSLNICIPAFVSQILFLFTSLRLIIYMISYVASYLDTWRDWDTSAKDA